ncbi:hypothetical protein [Streptomyces olivaceiscleroticus]|uniref:Uncharacterized protein n=1 Tax=Streptomyces olivaceiscleroticus TaxID=68245 RepID=A0ABP3JKN8_9ACTN
MSVPPETDSRRHQRGRAVWPLLITMLVILALGVGLGVLYVTWRHPSLAAPVQAAAAGLAVFAAVLGLVLPRR